MDSITDLYNNFYKNPSLSNWEIILNNKEFIYETIGKAATMFYRKCELIYNYNANLTPEQLALYEYEINRLNSDVEFAAFDLTCLWSLFFASGDYTYSDKVRDFALNPNLNILLRTTSNLSYNQYINNNILQNRELLVL